MLKKKLGFEAIEKDSWTLGVIGYSKIGLYFKIPSTLVIPDGCKWVGDWAFWRCKKLRKVVIPESVKVIEDFAFKECRDLEEVEIPKSVRWIGEEAFEGCKKATIILKKLKNEFKEIQLRVFSGVKDVRYAKEEVRN